jgi:hypothetical protein
MERAEVFEHSIRLSEGIHGEAPRQVFLEETDEKTASYLLQNR